LKISISGSAKYKKCGAKCCSEGIQLTIDDIKRIKDLGYSPDDFLEFDENANIFKIKGKEGKCFFTGKKLECTIRDNEPLVCRLLPFKIIEVSYSDEPLMRLKQSWIVRESGRVKRSIRKISSQMLQNSCMRTRN